MKKPIVCRWAGALLIVAGCLLILCVAGMEIIGLKEAVVAGMESERIARQLEEEIPLSEEVKTLSGGREAIALDGAEYLGLLYLPCLDVPLPVSCRISPALLKKSPCRYFGSVQENDLVICAHNYSRHFGHLADLCPGDALFFFPAGGGLIRYEVAECVMVEAWDIQAVCGETWPLTLFTCTPGGEKRVVVRCSYASGEEV